MSVRFGILKSPYGYMTVGTKRIENGAMVYNRRLQGVEEIHLVPVHWISQDPELLKEIFPALELNKG
ncbi:hypothetical protein KAR91_54400 [Candidatus Pacearchaeota archaeon]|nr:hypothetical protein [Candidatus Pacearchaeota archaeon]